MNLNNKRTQFLQTFISCLRYSLGCYAVMMNGSGVARANMSTHDRVSLSHVAPQKEVLLVEQRHLHRSSSREQHRIPGSSSTLFCPRCDFRCRSAAGCPENHSEGRGGRGDDVAFGFQSDALLCSAPVNTPVRGGRGTAEGVGPSVECSQTPAQDLSLLDGYRRFRG